MARVNHGFARNFLVPNKLAAVVPQPRRRRGSSSADEAAAEQQQRQQAAAASSGDHTLERQQQQFDKLLKTLTGSALVRGPQSRKLHACAMATFHKTRRHVQCLRQASSSF